MIIRYKPYKTIKYGKQMIKKYIPMLAVHVFFFLLATKICLAADMADEVVDLDNGLILHPTNNSYQNKYAVVVHGFNVKPELMKPAIRYFTDAGIPTILVKLSGHRADSVMSLDNWLKDVKHAVGLAWQFVDKNKDKGQVILLGHSLGGALSTIVAANDDIKVSQLILLAPANGLKPLANILNIKGLTNLPSNSEFIRGVKPLISFATLFPGKNLLSGSGTKLCGKNAYCEDLTIENFEALINASEYSASNLIIEKIHQKTLIIVDREDGLIDYQTILRLFSQKPDCLVEVFSYADDPISAHTFQDRELLNKAMEKIMKFIQE